MKNNLDDVRLIDANKLAREGWVLTRHGIGNRLVERKSLADVPTAYDIENLLEENSMLRGRIKYMQLKGGASDDC